MKCHLIVCWLACSNWYHPTNRREFLTEELQEGVVSVWRERSSVRLVCSAAQVWENIWSTVCSLFTVDNNLLSTSQIQPEPCLKGRCCSSQQDLCFSSYPGLVDWSSERSATTFPTASISSMKKLHHWASLKQNTSQYASATNTRTTLPPCITVGVVHHCTLPINSVFRRAKTGPVLTGSMNHR